jgi:hypothetical protein
MKLFTLAEANLLLPELRRLFALIQRERGLLQRLGTEAKRASNRATESGGTVFGAQYVGAIFQVMDCLQTIAQLGVEIKDLERGLCDFPSLREGRVVYLCWLLGEDQIEWWHDLETGFAGRQPL